MAVGLPLSKFMMSVSQFTMGAAWLLEGNYSQKIERFKANFKLLLPFLLIYFVNFIGLGWTSNWTFGLHDVKVKIPLIVLPFMAATMPTVSAERISILIKTFLLAVFAGVMVSLYFYFGLSGQKLNDIREISRFISHIRFSLMVCLSVFFSLHFFLQTESKYRYAWLFAALFFAAFLFILQSSTGIVILLAGGIFSMFYFLWKLGSGKVFYASLTFVALLFTIALALVYDVWYHSFAHRKPIAEQMIHNGRHPYYHDTNFKATENGNYIWINADVDGMKRGWLAKTGISLEGDDTASINRIFILMRYISSLGLPKDSETVVNFSPKQIEDIKCNCTNYRYCNSLDPRHRIYETFWEIQDYKIWGNADGHSVVMRLEFWRAAYCLIYKHIWFGVGTGDVADEFWKTYKRLHSSLDFEYQHRSHNQFLTYAVAIGVPGLILILLGFMLWIKNLPAEGFLHFPARIFALIVLLSMLNEDTLETQPGVSFLAFFVIVFWKK